MGLYQIKKLGHTPECHGKFVTEEKAVHAWDYLTAQDGELPEAAAGRYGLEGPDGKLLATADLGAEADSSGASEASDFSE